MTNSTIAIFPMTLIRAGGLPLSAWIPFACGMPDWARVQKGEQTVTAHLLLAFDEALLSLVESPLRTAVYNARKDFFQRRKAPSVNFETLFKADPSLSQLFETLHLWKKTKQDRQIAEGVFEENLAANYKALQVIARDETIHRALLFASHDLLASLPAFVSKQVENFDKKDRRTAFSLLQYLTRAVFKTSPLGRFTTVQAHSLYKPDLEGSSKFQPIDELSSSYGFKMSKPLVSPNVALLPAVYEVLLREPVFFQSLTLRLNPCLQGEKVGASWLYFDGEREAFQQIEPDLVVDFVVKTLLENQRELPYAALIELLKSEVEAAVPQLQSLLAQLIDIGMLEWQLPERGLSPSWCGGLYNYLGYLPSSPVLTESAYMLQWLRTAARTMPFQTMEEAQNLQRETLKEVKTFLEKHGGVMPPIPPEQIFFEDVAQDNQVNLPRGIAEKLISQLAECWRAQDFHVLSAFRTRIFDFAQKSIAEGQRMDFLEFSRAFLEMSGEPVQDTRADFFAEAPRRPVKPRHQGKVGALLQIFEENGAYKAVVNALYPGGGKLFARWLPLFSAEVSEQLKIWHNTDEVQTVAFPWQGWSNANFQSTFSSVSLEVPDGRVGHLPSGRAILLADLAIRRDAYGFPQLIEKQSNQPLVFNDLGLEAPITRPPVMQILWHLGVPMVSLDALLPQGFGWEKQGEIRYRRKVEFQSLILSRSAWELSPEVWGKLFAESNAQAERIGLGIVILKALGIPRYFFGQFTARREKPQFFDMESPISMLLLEKNLRGGAGNLLLTEMLPTPEQWLGDRVGEFVVEFQVS